jgi:hypothetical protein
MLRLIFLAAIRTGAWCFAQSWAFRTLTFK